MFVVLELKIDVAFATDDMHFPAAPDLTVPPPPK
jgi:hypothetical protein